MRSTHVGRLGPAGAAVGVDRRGVGEHRRHLGVDRRRRVLAGEQRRVQDRRHRRREGRQVGAHVGDRCGRAARGTCRPCPSPARRGDVVAAVRVGEERLAALGRPLDRPADAACWPRPARRLPAYRKIFEPKPPPTSGAITRTFVLRQAEHEGAHQQPLDVRVLVGDVERVARRRRGCSCALAARGSIAFGISRLLTRSSLVTCARLGERRVDRRLVAVAPVVAGVVGRRRRAPRVADRRRRR